MMIHHACCNRVHCACGQIQLRYRIASRIPWLRDWEAIHNADGV